MTETEIKPLPRSGLNRFYFELFYGKGPSNAEITVSISADADQKVESIEVSPAYCLYNSMRLFFDNGGGTCFIASVGTYASDGAVDVADFNAGLDAIRKVDEPTLLLSPDASLLDDGPRASFQQAMLAQANDLKDRFAILDVLNDPNKKRFDLTEAEAFRNQVGASNLDYGAAYYPFLRTSYGRTFSFSDIQLSQSNADVDFSSVGSNPAFLTEVE